MGVGIILVLLGSYYLGQVLFPHLAAGADFESDDDDKPSLPPDLFLEKFLTGLVLLCIGLKLVLY